MLERTYFVIGVGRQRPYEIRMLQAKCQLSLLPRASFRRASSALGALALLSPLLALPGVIACSRGNTTEPAPAASAAAPSSPVPLAPGAAAPAVTFALHTGEQLALESLRGKPVVVYFYPKDDTPGCTIEAQEIRDLYEQLKQTGAVVIGVSTDARDSHRAFAEKHALPFLLASDEDGRVAKAFGVALKNGRVTRESFVIGADGRIKRTFPQVTPKGHAAELLAAISS
jgi:peroxiredoxin Q/BCP